MPINETLSQYSDLSYMSAVAVYVLAMVFFLVEQSFGRKGAAAAERSRQRGADRAGELVGAGAASTGTIGVQKVGSEPDGSDTTDVSPDRPGTARSGGEPSRAERIGRMGASLLILGVGLHLAALVLRGLAANRVPWGNMYEAIMVLCFVAVATWLVMMRKFPVRHLSAFLLLPVVILMFLGGTVLYAVAGPVSPALQSYWLVIHVAAIVGASGIFLVPGMASCFYLIRSRHERDPGKFARFGPKLASLNVLDRIAYRTTVLAFPIFTFGVICGAIWAEAAWGRFWGWDPKETVAFITWVVYAAYLHSRATAGWRGRRAAVINVIGFGVVIFNLFFVNLVVAGLHSYAGV